MAYVPDDVPETQMSGEAFYGDRKEWQNTKI